MAISSTALCLRPSAIDPPPISVLLKTKAEPQFDRTVDRTVEAFFPVFQGFNQAQFQPCFLVFTVRSAGGRKCESRAAQAFQFEEMFPSVILFFTEKQRIERNAALANCQLLSANCLVVKDLPTSTPEGCHTLADSPMTNQVRNNTLHTNLRCRSSYICATTLTSSTDFGR